MSELGDWFRSIPVLTRYWFALSISFALIGRFGFIHPQYFYLLYEQFIWNFQIWRAATALFFYPMSFPFLINLYFLYHYSQRLETEVFSGRTADYLYMLIFSWIFCVIISLMWPVPLLMNEMVMVVLYMWCQLNQEVVVTFWFGTQFKAKYFPWVLLAFNWILGGNFIVDLIGILVGHLYFFLKFKYPVDFGGPALLNTPQILYRYFPNQRQFGGFGQAPVNRGNAAPGNDGGGGGGGGGGHNWGRGNILGRNN